METIAPGVHLVRGGFGRVMNVYLIEDQDGVTMFDAGVRSMTKSLLKAAEPLGGIKRVVLGHSHPDHRGAAKSTAAASGAGIYCHEAELGDAEGDGGVHYFRFDEISFGPGRALIRHSLANSWDEGPLAIEGTLVEGDTIAGFDVIHMPGHAPGLIALYRESDGLVLCSDTIYTFNPLTGIKGAARIPLEGFNLDTQMAQASALKLSALDPKTVWPGHANAVDNDAPAVLEELGRQSL